MVFIEADIVSLPRESYLSLRELVSAETGIPVENTMLGCVHNHAAPSMDERNNESGWSQQFNSNIVKSVKRLLPNLNLKNRRWYWQIQYSNEPQEENGKHAIVPYIR